MGGAFDTCGAAAGGSKQIFILQETVKVFYTKIIVVGAELRHEKWRYTESDPVPAVSKVEHWLRAPG